jgi:hypothetical protein
MPGTKYWTMIPPKIGIHGVEPGPSNEGKVKRSRHQQKQIVAKNKQRNLHLDIYKS